MFKYVRYTNFSKMCFFPEKNSQFPEDMEKSSELSAFLGAVPVLSSEKNSHSCTGYRKQLYIGVITVVIFIDNPNCTFK